MVTDRKELDDQLYEEFKDAGGSREGHVQADLGTPRRLLGADHRYVFTLIHKFRPRSDESRCRSLGALRRDRDHRRSAPHPVLDARTEHAQGAAERRLPRLHRHAADHRRGATRRVFGDYVSTYNFRDSIDDGATVPLFYENRIPELQIVNEASTRS